MPPLVDANVFLRFLLDDHPEQSARCASFFARIERGELVARVADVAIFETVFTLERTYRHAKSSVAERVQALLDLPGLQVSNKRRLGRAFELYVEFRLPFGDSMQIALLEQLNEREIISFDADFDRVPSVERVEP